MAFYNFGGQEFKSESTSAEAEQKAHNGLANKVSMGGAWLSEVGTFSEKELKQMLAPIDLDAKAQESVVAAMPAKLVGTALFHLPLVKKFGWISVGGADPTKWYPRMGTSSREVVPFVGFAYVIATFCLKKDLNGEVVFTACPAQSWDARWQNNTGFVAGNNRSRFLHTFGEAPSHSDPGLVNLGLGRLDSAAVFLNNNVRLDGSVEFSPDATWVKPPYRGVKNPPSMSFYLNLSGHRHKNGEVENNMAGYPRYLKGLAKDLHEAGAPLGINCECLVVTLVENAYCVDPKGVYTEPLMTLIAGGFRLYWRELEKPLGAGGNPRVGRSARKYALGNSGAPSAFWRIQEKWKEKEKEELTTPPDLSEGNLEGLPDLAGLGNDAF